MKYPAKHIADELATHGRYGDSRLIHVNEAELQGIAALMPGGKLTTNPVTGQPEAFLPFLLPMLASWGGSAAAGAGLMGGTLAGAGALSAGIGSAIGGGIGSALATTALTGDAKRGLASGIMGAGIGSALGAAGAGADAVTGDLGGSLTDLSGAIGSGGATAAPTAIEAAGLMGQLDPSTLGLQNEISRTLAGEASALQGAAAPTNFASAISGGSTPAATPSFGEALKAPFQKGSGLAGNLMKPTSIIPTVVGMGQLSELDDRDAFEDFAAERAGTQDAKRKAAFDDRQRSYLAAQPNVARGISPLRSQMSRRTPLPQYAASGGITRIGMAEGGSAPQGNNQQTQDGGRGRFGGGGGYWNVPIGPDGLPQFGAGLGIDPVTVQANLRGATPVSPPSGYMAGFQPEFSYFQDDINSPADIQVPNQRNQGRMTSDLYKGLAPLTQGQLSTIWGNPGMYGQDPYFNSIIPGGNQQPNPNDPNQPPPGDPTISGPTRPPVGPPPRVDLPHFPLDPPPTDDGPGPVVSGPNPKPGDDAIDPPWFPDDGAGTGPVITLPPPDGTQPPVGTLPPTSPPPPGGNPKFPVEPPKPISPLSVPGGIQFPDDSNDVLMPINPQAELNELAGTQPTQQPNWWQGASTNQTALDWANANGRGTPGGYAHVPGAEMFNQMPDGSFRKTSPSSWAPLGANVIPYQGAQLHQQENFQLSPAYQAYQQAWQKGTDLGLTQEEIKAGAVAAGAAEWDRSGTGWREGYGPGGREQMAEGGRVPLNTSLGNASVEAGGIANLQNEFTQPQQPTPEDVQMLASALLGQSEQLDQIVEMFVGKYGPEMFQQIRQMIVSQGNPNTQTEGLIQGQGGGMADQVQGMIGSEQPVAVSPGEFIVPADIVSGLGDGSTDAGARELDQMMANVRKARGGSTTQPPAIDAKALMPR